MTVLGKITVKLSDDARYVAGQTYDVVLDTPIMPDPANLVLGSIDVPAATTEAVTP
ncbi:MAG: hypothetical protein ABSD62_15195 [Candidatus Limnocylindrales bacterium]|jgi:hypothetical protein